MSVFKIMLVGNTGVGKTTWAKRILINSNQYRSYKPSIYTPTQGVKVGCVKFNTTITPIVFNIWDCDDAMNLTDSYCESVDGAIIMLDASEKDIWGPNVSSITGDIPVIVCTNKIDLISDERLLFARENSNFCNISVRTSKNINQPLLLLARKLTGELDLEFF